MTLGWSFEKLAKTSNVAVASVYLLERMGTAGPEDDASIWDVLNKHLAERSQHVAAENLSNQPILKMWSGSVQLGIPWRYEPLERTVRAVEVALSNLER